MNTSKKLILECNAKAFKENLNHVNKTKSNDDSRVISKVKFFLNEEELVLSSTDGNRLSQRSLSVKSTLSSFNEICEREYLILNTNKEFVKILSRINNHNVLKLYQERGEKKNLYTFEIEVKAKITAFNDCEKEIRSISLFDYRSNFPNIESIIPKEEKLKFQIRFKSVETIEFLKDLKAFVGRSWGRIQRIILYKVNQQHYLFYDESQNGIIDKEVNFIEYSDLKEGEPLALNISYLLDSIEDKPDIATFKTENFLKNVLCRIEEKKLDLVMPMHNDNIKLPSWEKKRELIEKKKQSYPFPKEIPKHALVKSNIEGQDKSKKTKELLKRSFNIQFRKSPRLYRKFTFQLERGHKKKKPFIKIL